MTMYRSFKDVPYGRIVDLEAVVTSIQRSPRGCRIAGLTDYWDENVMKTAFTPLNGLNLDDVYVFRGSLNPKMPERDRTVADDILFQGSVVQHVGRINDPRILDRRRRYVDQKNRMSNRVP